MGTSYPVQNFKTLGPAAPAAPATPPAPPPSRAHQNKIRQIQPPLRPLVIVDEALRAADGLAELGLVQAALRQAQDERWVVPGPR